VVLRKSDGDQIAVIDSAGQSFSASLLIGSQRVFARLESRIAPIAAPSIAITLAQGIPKGQKMDFVVEKATELGVARIVPFSSERSVGEGEREGKLERWRRLARAAAQQCGRPEIPAVEPPVSWSALVARIGLVDRALVPWEGADPVPLRTRLGPVIEGKTNLMVIVGPEGGLSHGEVEAAEACGAIPVSLGNRIFRTETAGLVACTALLYESGSL
jgi:16S rRNA (uracil1498-N3)-methyltransferase